MRKFFVIKLCLSLFLIFTSISCSDFLNEDLETQRSTDFFNTEEGINELAVGMYYNLRIHHAAEWSYCTTNYGTDEFRVGGDASNAPWNHYNNNFGPIVLGINGNVVQPSEIWDNMYFGIHAANLLIEKTTEFLEDGEKKNILLGEGLFVRGFNHFKLIKQYGAVPLKIKSSAGPEREFTRTPVQEVIEQIIMDFTIAYDLLPETGVTGRITKDAAAHFLAKAYLYRASEINDDWNGSLKEADLQASLNFSEELIKKRTLASDFRELWDYTGPDGPNEQLDEVILSAQFTGDNSTHGRYGNQQHLFFLSQYLNLPYMKRDLAGGREYQRLRTTYYTYEIFDVVKDSRFWKSFKTKYSINNPSDEYDAGDLGVIYIANKKDDGSFASEAELSQVTDEVSGKKVPSVFPLYVGGENYLQNDARNNRFFSLSKYLDGTRAFANDVQGRRDGILARLGETYLNAAEACIRLGDYSKALDYINDIRDRAKFKDGEDRKQYTDGGSTSPDPINTFYPENSYYESTGEPVTTNPTSLRVDSWDNLPPEDEAVIEKLGVSGQFDRALCFLLNERSRELLGEFHRWEDLSRTKRLIDRVKAYNFPAADNIQEKHYLRPIPQSFLDALQMDGGPLTQEERANIQNPGY